jgi:hypothetical protein
MESNRFFPCALDFQGSQLAGGEPRSQAEGKEYTINPAMSRPGKHPSRLAILRGVLLGFRGTGSRPNAPAGGAMSRGWIQTDTPPDKPSATVLPSSSFRDRSRYPDTLSDFHATSARLRRSRTTNRSTRRRQMTRNDAPVRSSTTDLDAEASAD